MFAFRLAQGSTKTVSLVRFITNTSPIYRAPSVTKLQLVLTEYREKNYGQCLPSRFVKEMIRAADVNQNKISRAALSRLLTNIGASDALSTDEINEIFDSAGEMDDTLSDQVIHTSFVQALVLDKQHFARAGF